MTQAASINEIESLRALEHRWRALEEKSNGSFFTSWNWIGSWLSLTRAKPYLFQLRDGARDIALGIVTRNSVQRYFLPSQSLYLNQSGFEDEDLIFMEYNGLLVERGREQEAYASFLNMLSRETPLAADLKWSEVQLAGIRKDNMEWISDSRIVISRCIEKVAPFVDLHKVRAANNDYLRLLSGQTRQQIRRALNLYEKDSPLKITKIEHAEAAKQCLEHMKKLHIERFASSQIQSSFEVPFFIGFLESLLGLGMKDNSVQLLKIASEEQVIGYTINFIHGQTVANYQSAICRPLNNQHKPGLVSQALTIRYYAKTNATKYSFLAGDSQYKRSLSTNTESLIWVTLKRNSPWAAVEHLARRFMK